MKRFTHLILLFLMPLLLVAAPYKRISNIDTDVFQVSSKGELSIKSTATGVTLSDLTVNGASDFVGGMSNTDTLVTGASEGATFKSTLTTANTFTGTTGYKFKVYDADNAVVHNGGEHTAVYANMKLLSAMQAGGKSVIFSGHNYGSGGDYQAIDAGVWLYGNLVDAFKVSGGTSTTGIDFSEQTISSEEILLSNSESIKNTTNGTIEFGSGVLKHAVDAAAYWTATQADAGAVTFDSVSDGTAGFTFSDNVTLATTKTLTIGTEQIAQESTVDGLNVKRIARATFDPSTNAGERTIAAHGLGVTLPDNAVVTRAWYDVITTFQSTDGGADKATIAISIEGANDVVTAVAIETGTPFDAGFQEGIQDGTAATFIKTSAAKEITATVAVAALTAGKLILYVEYVVSD